MVVFVTCKNEEDPFKNKGARDDAQGKLTQQSENGFYIKFKLIQAFMIVHPTSRMKKVKSKMKALEWPQQCYIFYQFVDAQWQLTQ